ncbi:MAG: hypothetical protein MUE32_11800 [Bacteroidales bacterium]|nr:hypothetical protein [Bacteroidales bacterium]
MERHSVIDLNIPQNWQAGDVPHPSVPESAFMHESDSPGRFPRSGSRLSRPRVDRNS